MGFAGPGVLEELRSPGSCDQRVGDLHSGVKGPIHEVGALGQGKVTALPPGGVCNEEGTLIVDGTRISEKSIERSLQTRIRQSQSINGRSNVRGGRVSHICILLHEIEVCGITRVVNIHVAFTRRSEYGKNVLGGHG